MVILTHRDKNKHQIMPNPENSSKHEQKKNDVIAFIAESKVQ